MAPEQPHQDLALEHTEDLARFESEGGSSEHDLEPDDDLQGRRDLLSQDSDHRGRILIVCGTEEHQTYVIADAIAVRLRRHGFAVEIGDAAEGTMPPPQDYDVVILGLSMTSENDNDVIATYVERNREALSEVPAALFTVSKAGTLRGHDPGGFLEQFMRTRSWRPVIAAAFAGGEPFPREGVLLRLREWMGTSGAPQEAAAFRTNWTDVRRFADTIAIELASAAVTADRSEPHR
jgi:menaquinone-dependent protoporphyrinogen oxidase